MHRLRASYRLRTEGRISNPRQAHDAGRDGSMRMQFERLKKKLLEEGLFEESAQAPHRVCLATLQLSSP